MQRYTFFLKEVRGVKELEGVSYLIFPHNNYTGCCVFSKN